MAYKHSAQNTTPRTSLQVSPAAPGPEGQHTPFASPSPTHRRKQRLQGPGQAKDLHMDFKISVPLLWFVKTEHQSSVSHPSLQRRPPGKEWSSSVPHSLDRASQAWLTGHLVSALCPPPGTPRSPESKESVRAGARVLRTLARRQLLQEEIPV